MNLEELLEEAEVGVVYTIEKLPDGTLKVTTKYTDGYVLTGKGRTLQEALDDEE